MKIAQKISALLRSKGLLTLLMMIPFLTQAQERPEMADSLRSNGKIYVVVLVICTIFAGIILFLIYLERKIKKLEQNHNN